MKPDIGFYIVAGISLVLIPLVPKMIGLRVRLLHALHLNRLANWHDRNRRILIPVVRIILFILAVTLISIGLSGGPGAQ